MLAQEYSLYNSVLEYTIYTKELDAVIYESRTGHIILGALPPDQSHTQTFISYLRPYLSPIVFSSENKLGPISKPPCARK